MSSTVSWFLNIICFYNYIILLAFCQYVYDLKRIIQVFCK